jgi:tRNA pseudouridine38-40 synthase
MQRWAIGVEYLGTQFAGWQHQYHANAVQQVVERALSSVADLPVSLVVAGRTDAGVHATGQVAHFDTEVRREPRSWLLGANSNLPETVNLTWALAVPGEFHARYSAISRSYRYRIINRDVRSAVLADRCWWIHGPLDTGSMQVAANYLLGEHDFSAFRAAECQAKTPMRNLQAISVARADDIVTIECRANAFLQHMVRNVVGSLVCVGRGDRRPEWIANILQGRDRRLAGVTAPPQGLCLTRVEYPQEFGIPRPRTWQSDL